MTSERDQIQEILKKVRKIEFKIRGLVHENFGGEYHSSFKGQGIDFDEFREYQHGDEVRAIDWNVTARFGTPFIKKFVEERELSVFFAVDISASGNYGSQEKSKRELAAEVAALLAFSAIENKDKVGLILFTDQIELFLPPHKGRSHGLRMIREILSTTPQGRGTDPKIALDLLLKTTKRRSLVFLLSDFLGPDFSTPLRIINQKHDIIALQIGDPLEYQFPKIGWVHLTDPETQEEITLNTSKKAVRQAYHQLVNQWQHDLDQLFKKLKIDKIRLLTHQDYLPKIHQLFQSRSLQSTF